MNIKTRQSGIALLMAILIVALVSIISVQMITERQLQIYRTTNLYFHDQAYLYSRGIEQWALSALQQDFTDDLKKPEKIDSHQDVWNTALIDLDVEQAKVAGTILDLQGRFNLNNLVKEGKVQVKWLQAYKRLLTELELPQSLAETLVDWLDTDEQPTGSSGAEDIYYIALEQPYRTANQILIHPSELLLVKGYDDKTYKALKNYVYVAPEETAININTCSELVLQMVIPGISTSQAGSLLSRVKNAPFLNVDELLNDPQLKDKAVETAMLSVSSQYFAVNSYVQIDKVNVSLQSIINRSKQGNVQVISRQESILYDKQTVSSQSEQPE